MRATVTREFKGLADGAVSERYFVEGEVIYGDLATRAVDEGNAEPSPAPPRRAEVNPT